ncbi:MAG: DUF1684 domain-containing protein [Reichenbachiella sp.]|uniref:DUF1684 domain-containing protein n=1 Tax=Reichenbachiella sp. TaxID=2184521 RepID=UPI003263A646
MHLIQFKFLKLSLPLFFIALLACEPKEQPLTDEYFNLHKEFQQELGQGRDHYLKLVGLHPLVNGTNLFGASEVNNIQLTSADLPATIGAVEFSGDSIWFVASDSLQIRFSSNDSLVSRAAFDFSDFPNSPLLKWNHLEWQVIKRADEYFLRVKDHNSSEAGKFKGFEAYPLQSKYVLEADYKPYKEKKTKAVNTQLGTAQQLEFSGVLNFTIGEMALELLVSEDGFVIVGDQTNDKTTYGGGRYVYVDLPTSGGKTILDLNRLYNPPCVYSKFTTCPLPPAPNVLPIEITAGEKTTRL